MTPGRALVTAVAYEGRPGRGRPDNAGARRKAISTPLVLYVVVRRRGWAGR